jgi:hypothetical protein
MDKLVFFIIFFSFHAGNRRQGMRREKYLYYNVYPVGQAVWCDPVFARVDI